jgi:hypothetical protein
MRSRFLIGACGWLLGAATATCGSMLAVSQLAHGLLGPGTQQLSAADVRNDLASSHRASTDPAASATPAPSTPDRRPARPSTPRPTAADGTLLVSRAGSAMASCQAGLAYLQYWSPAPGYQADDVFRGPAATVRLVFESAGPSLVLNVSCAGDRPVQKLATAGDDDGGGHDE